MTSRITSRSWVLTLNNFTQAEWVDLTKMEEVSYGVFGREGKCVAACYHGQGGIPPADGYDGNFVCKQHTPHVQAAFTLSKPVKFAWLKRKFPRAHIEKMQATGSARKKAFDYCQKEGDFVIIDVRPSRQGSSNMRERVASFVSQLESGASLEDIINDDAVEAVMGHRRLEWAALHLTRPRETAPEVIWLYGATGTGKTTRVLDEVGSKAYWHTSSNFKWWSMYQGQAAVVLEEFRGGHEPLNGLLRLFDKAPLAVETKGGHVQMLADVFYVTTPYSPDNVYRNEDGAKDEALAQLKRRITQVVRCFIRDGRHQSEDMTQHFGCGEFFRIRDEGTGEFIPVPVMLRQPSSECSTEIAESFTDACVDGDGCSIAETDVDLEESVWDAIIVPETQEVLQDEAQQEESIELFA